MQNKCLKPNCDCIEKEMQKQGTECIKSYPCLYATTGAEELKSALTRASEAETVEEEGPTVIPHGKQRSDFTLEDWKHVALEAETSAWDCTKVVLENCDLKAHISALQKEVEELKQAQMWIPVEKRLPERYQACAFVVKSSDERYNGKVYGGKYTGRATSWDKHEFSCPGFGFEASHWMPLPQPPKH